MKITNLLVAGAISLAAAATASAGTIRVADGLAGLNGTDPTGGAFIVTSLTGYNGETGGPGGSATSFATFCLERSENLSFGPIYTTTIDTAAKLGGVSGGNPDPISEATALLYYTFRKGGAIAGDVVDTADEVSGLQYAFWTLEGEGTPAGTPAVNAFAAAYISWATSNAVTGQFLNVRVLNPYQNGAPRQSLLTLVPLPTAAWMGLGLLGSAAGVSYMRRRSVMA